MKHHFSKLSQLVSRSLAAICGCVDDVAYKPSRLCTLEEDPKMECVDDVSIEFNPTISCDCPDYCESVTYDVLMSKLIWPIRRSIPQFLATVHQNVKNNITKNFLLEALRKHEEEKLQTKSDALDIIRSTFGRFRLDFFLSLSWQKKNI